MKPPLDYFSKIALVLVAFTCLTQNLWAQVEEVSPIKLDSTSHQPSGVGVSIDYGKLFTLPSKFEQKGEIGISLNIRKKFIILTELGFASLSPETGVINGSYTSSGNYGRIGLGFGGGILPKSYLFGGLLYGLADYGEEGQIVIEGQGWPDYDEPLDHQGLRSTWFELVLISEQEMTKNLILGIKFRFRFGLDYDGDLEPAIYAVPGYGRVLDETIPAANLYVKYRLSFGN